MSQLHLNRSPLTRDNIYTVNQTKSWKLLRIIILISAKLLIWLLSTSTPQNGPKGAAHKPIPAIHRYGRTSGSTSQCSRTTALMTQCRRCWVHISIQIWGEFKICKVLQVIMWNKSSLSYFFGFVLKSENWISTPWSKACVSLCVCYRAVCIKPAAPKATTPQLCQLSSQAISCQDILAITITYLLKRW